MTECDFDQTVALHAVLYPLMQPCDLVKLAYQSEFGGGHMITDPAACEKRFADELNVTPFYGCERFTPIGGDFWRMNLAACRDIPIYAAARIFAASSEEASGTDEGMRERLDIIRGLCESGIFGFDSAAFAAYTDGYIKSGGGAVGHSDIYRNAYAPHYRVISNAYAQLYDTVNTICGLTDSHDSVIIAIDGRAASGKTTIAFRLSKLFDAPVIHADDFFLPFEMRTPERLSKAGGNIHSERLKEEVIDRLRGETFSYGVFDCSKGQIDGKAEIKRSKVTIIEGAYCLLPEFGHYYDLALFVTVTPDEQVRRIRSRNGEEMLERFQKLWIPMEEQYIAYYDIDKPAADKLIIGRNL